MTFPYLRCCWQRYAIDTGISRQQPHAEGLRQQISLTDRLWFDHLEHHLEGVKHRHEFIELARIAVDLDEARNSVRRLRDGYPELTLARVTDGLPPLPQASRERLVEALHDVGLPP